MIRLGVTGTDTGVGKTVITVALVALLRRRGLRVAAMKPVETGVLPGAPTDAARLRAAAGGKDRPGDVSPATYAEPLAPLVAARRAGRPVDLEALAAAFARLAARRDAIVVEGAGGLLVPLTDHVSYAELFAGWRLGLVVVAANRLGAINHVLLTVHAARTAELEIRGVVLNAVTGAVPDAAAQTNAAALARLLPDIPVLSWPWLTDVSDDALATRAVQLGLGVLIDDPAPTPLHLNITERTT
jgi:dethiobiotin synthetase